MESAAPDFVEAARADTEDRHRHLVAVPIARWRLFGGADVVEDQVESRAHTVTKPVDVGGVLRCTGVNVPIDLTAEHASVAYVPTRELLAHRLTVCGLLEPEPAPVWADVGGQIAWDEHGVNRELEQVSVDHEDMTGHRANLSQCRCGVSRFARSLRVRVS